MLDCEDWRVCHGVLAACWSVKIGIGRGGVSRCALCILVCENWHWQRGVCFACGSVKLGMGGSGVG